MTIAQTTLHGTAIASVRPISQLLGPHAWRLALHHDRDHHLLIWITRGQGRISLGGVRRGIGAHNAAFVPAATLLACELSAQTQGMVAQIHPDACPDFPTDPLHVRAREVQAQAELTAQIDAIHREVAQVQPMQSAAVRAHLGLIAVWLHRYAALGDADQPANTAALRLVRRFAARVVADHTMNQAMAGHARALGVTPTHLTRVCRSLSGLSAADILTQRRIYTARQMLAQESCKIRDIADHLGFTSPAYFTRFIQQHCGMSPSAFRQSQ